MKTPRVILPRYSALVLSIAFSGLGASAWAQGATVTISGALIDPLTVNTAISGGTLSLGTSTSSGASTSTIAAYNILTAATMGTDSGIATVANSLSQATMNGSLSGTTTILSGANLNFGTLNLGGSISATNTLTIGNVWTIGNAVTLNTVANPYNGVFVTQNLGANTTLTAAAMGADSTVATALNGGSGLTLNGVTLSGTTIFNTVGSNYGTLQVGISNWGYNSGALLVVQGSIGAIGVLNSSVLTFNSANGINSTATTANLTLNNSTGLTSISNGTSGINVGTIQLGSGNLVLGNSINGNLITLATGAVVENPGTLIPLSLGSTVPVTTVSVSTASNNPSLTTGANLVLNGTQLATSGTGFLTLFNGSGTTLTTSGLSTITLAAFNSFSGNTGTLVFTNGTAFPVLTAAPALAPVPEPTALALVAIGAFSLLGRKSRRRA